MFGNDQSSLMLGNSHIQPRPVYAPWQTQQAMSQVQGAHRAYADPQVAQKAFDRPGMSRGEGSFAAALPGMMKNRVAGNVGAANLSLDDMVANQGNLLTGSIARDREMQGLGNLALNIYGINQNAALNSLGNQVNFFNRLANSGY